MEFTFGIITGGNQDAMLTQILNSIEKQNIPHFEVIIVGKTTLERSYLTVINFPENIQPMWITKKKNIIGQLAKYENIVFLHDYIAMCPGWYEGFQRFGNDGWDVCMNRMLENNGSRAIDWMGLPNDPVYGNVLLPYDYCNPSGMYVPGNYFVVKKTFFQNNPLDENRIWCEGEDIEWSKRIFGGADNTEWLRRILRKPMGLEIPNPPSPARYKMNVFSAVQFLKDKPTHEDFRTDYDYHSGDNSRPNGYKIEDYEYMKRRFQRKIEQHIAHLLCSS
jgi:hypothetical protein